MGFIYTKYCLHNSATQSIIYYQKSSGNKICPWINMNLLTLPLELCLLKKSKQVPQKSLTCQRKVLEDNCWRTPTVCRQTVSENLAELAFKWKNIISWCGSFWREKLSPIYITNPDFNRPVEQSKVSFTDTREQTQHRNQVFEFPRIISLSTL